MIRLEKLSLRRGGKCLLADADATIYPGQKVALIGANGVGKSSLFELLLNPQHVDAGDISIPGNWRISHMAQEVAVVAMQAIDYVLDGDQELRNTERAIAIAEQGNDLAALASLHEKYDTLGGYSSRSRAEKLLHGLGFNDTDISKPVNTFSGGWRIRLNLAQALMCPADLLLLDEPTNHLDLDACLWLEDWLCHYAGTLMLISHDRDFIDKVCGLIVHIEHQQLQLYKGNYSAFERQRAENLARAQVSYEKQQRQIAKIHDFVRRFGAKASKAKQAQGRLKELERMELLAGAHVDCPFDFSFPPSPKVSDPLLSLDKAQMGYGHTVVLEDVELSVHPGSRWGLLGANGAGKSTFIRSLVGELPLLGGAKTCGEHLRIGYFSQHQVDALDLSASPVTLLRRCTPTATEQQIRDFLGGFNFRGDMALESLERRSGGEKARLALAVLVWQSPNLLLLDEPTNHLDIDMRHALTLALQDFAGAVVLVSHDRHLLRVTVDQFLLVEDGRVTPFEGDLTEYSRAQRLKVSEEVGGKVDGNSSGAAGADKRKQRQQSAELRKKLAPLRKDLSAIEQSLAETEQRLGQLTDELADNDLYQDTAKARLQALLLEQGRLQQAQVELELRWYRRWDELEELERAEATP